MTDQEKLELEIVFLLSDQPERAYELNGYVAYLAKQDYTFKTPTMRDAVFGAAIIKTRHKRNLYKQRLKDAQDEYQQD